MATSTINNDLSKAFKIKYQNTDWGTLHSFPVESVPRIGLILTHDGTAYSFAQYATGNINIQKIAGGHTITNSVSSGYNRLTVDASVGLIVLVS